MTAQWPWMGVVLLLWTASLLAHADTVETVLMPGKVIGGHADLEGDCKNCHVRFDKSAQTGLCLDCHKAVARDVAQHHGYHGRIEERECRVCHTDHKGRDVSIAPVDEARFDHDRTDFGLRGGHAPPKAACRDCHTPKRKYRDAPSDCYACHRNDDTHRGTLGKACANCHDERDWKKARFDHSQTRFPLTGKHSDVQCKDCHRDPQFKNTPTVCYACHKKDDEHKTRFGTKCESCHNDKAWKVILFDHDRDTKYRLTGKHRLAKCASCHAGFLYKEKTPTACIACHKKDDEHRGRFGAGCHACHAENDWGLSLFRHDRDTKYPLRGKHSRVNCTACHKGNLYKDPLPTTCYACHTKDDKHRGQEGRKCEQCHNERAWSATLFDHGLTRFPLLGGHAELECKKCHLTAAFKDADIECLSCHKEDDVHKRRLGPDCGLCHSARDWKHWSFDHDRRTRFRLDGGHRGLGCVACHKKPAAGRPRLAGSCVNCHEQDDVHDGSFGKQCERCHVASSFKRIRAGSGFTIGPASGDRR